ncbi:MAG: hypothetical protein RIA63_03815, partial [Cyclobacteriaceae bacterium]
MKNCFQRLSIVLTLLCVLVRAVTFAQSNTQFDIVLKGGRVLDPETKLDAIRNVGIKDGRIAEISTSALVGGETIDASGLVVSP